jgi:hypothetical protein
MVNSEVLASGDVRSIDAARSELYDRIQAFSLDKPDVRLSFSQRLANDNGWSLQFAQQAIEEYKKFAFLAVVAGHPVTPSDQVDQVWHLHLTYTRSYWEDFCSQVLQTPLHHEPTLGGEAEHQKFDDWYNKTLESYERFFGIKPPLEIWPTPQERFGRDLHFVRVNTQRHWVLAKLQVQKTVISNIAIFIALALSGCYMSDSEKNINPFMGILLAVTCVATVFGLIRFLVGIINLIKDPSRPQSRGVWDDSGSGSSGCGGWGWGDSSSHSSGDSGSGDGDGGGCGGCGGGGCGGCGG